MSKSRLFTGKGDAGTTGLLGPDRVPKFDLRPEAYGAVDEAQAALGLVRASGCAPRTGEWLLAVQRDLHDLMAELAAAGEPQSPFAGVITAEHVAKLERWIAELEAGIEIPKAFVVPGDSLPGATLHLARTVVRRAERGVARVAGAGLLRNEHVGAYMNRLSSLLFALALWQDQSATGQPPTLAKSET